MVNKNLIVGSNDVLEIWVQLCVIVLILQSQP